MEILVNYAYGGYRIPDEAWEAMKVQETEGFDRYLRRNYDRDNPGLIEFYKKNTEMFDTGISLVEIPDGCQFDISEYDGYESVQTFIEVTKEELESGLSPEKVQLAMQVDNIKVLLV